MVNPQSKYLSPLDQFLRQFGIEIKPVYIEGKRIHHFLLGWYGYQIAQSIKDPKLKDGLSKLSIWLMKDDFHDMIKAFRMED